MNVILSLYYIYRVQFKIKMSKLYHVNPVYLYPENTTSFYMYSNLKYSLLGTIFVARNFYPPFVQPTLFVQCHPFQVPRGESEIFPG